MTKTWSDSNETRKQSKTIKFLWYFGNFKTTLLVDMNCCYPTYEIFNSHRQKTKNNSKDLVLLYFIKLSVHKFDTPHVSFIILKYYYLQPIAPDFDQWTFLFGCLTLEVIHEREKRSKELGCRGDAKFYPNCVHLTDNSYLIRNCSTADFLSIVRKKLERLAVFIPQTNYPSGRTKST